MTATGFSNIQEINITGNLWKRFQNFNSMQTIVYMYITTNYFYHCTNSKEKAVSASFWNIQKPKKINVGKAWRINCYTNDSRPKHYENSSTDLDNIPILQFKIQDRNYQNTAGKCSQCHNTESPNVPLSLYICNYYGVLHCVNKATEKIKFNSPCSFKVWFWSFMWLGQSWSVLFWCG